MVYLHVASRRLVVRRNMVMLVTRQDSGVFFRDSAYLVRLGVTEGATHPIRLRAWYAGAGQTMLVSERDVRGAIEAVVGEHRDARAQVVGGGAVLPVEVPGVDVELGIWGEGGFTSKATLRCADERSRVSPVAIVPLNSQWGTATAQADLEAELRRIIDAAALAHCPAASIASRAAAAVQEPKASPTMSDGEQQAPIGPMVPNVRPSPSTQAAPASVTDSVAIAIIAKTNRPVVRLTMATDTMHLRVGEVLVPEHALRVTALRADGSIVPRFVPLYMVDDSRVAAMGAGGMRGVSPGVTRVVVRVMGEKLSTVTTDGASATFYVAVVP